MQKKVEETDVVMAEVDRDCISAILPSLHCLFIYIFHTGVSQPGEQGKANRHPPESYQSGRSKNIGGDVVFRYLDVKCRV